MANWLMKIEKNYKISHFKKIWQQWRELYFTHVTLHLGELSYVWAITHAKSESLYFATLFT